MPPFNHFTTKAKEAVRRAHELAVERGQNQVSPTHLLGALLLQEESLVASALERLEVDLVLLTDTVLEGLESAHTSSVLSPSYQLYLTPELVQALERSAKVATELHDEFVSTEHLFIAIIDIPGAARDLLARFRITRESVLRALMEIRSQKSAPAEGQKKFRALLKYTHSLTKAALENKLVVKLGSNFCRALQRLYELGGQIKLVTGAKHRACVGALEPLEHGVGQKDEVDLEPLESGCNKRLLLQEERTEEGGGAYLVLAPFN